MIQPPQPARPRRYRPRRKTGEYWPAKLLFLARTGERGFVVRGRITDPPTYAHRQVGIEITDPAEARVLAEQLTAWADRTDATTLASLSDPAPVRADHDRGDT